MGGTVKTGIKLKISYSDTILNYQLSQKLKLLGNDEFNHLIIILTILKGVQGLTCWRVKILCTRAKLSLSELRKSANKNSGNYKW